MKQKFISLLAIISVENCGGGGGGGLFKNWGGVGSF